jgi:hypothetical protein
MDFAVRFAIYGALRGGNPETAVAYDVTERLQYEIDQSRSKQVKANSEIFDDPSPGTKKQFGAIINRDGTDFLFACEEGQMINFAGGGGTVKKSKVTVKSAVYGCLPSGAALSKAQDVTLVLQQLLNNSDQPIACNNANFLHDPAPGYKKQFFAVVTRENEGDRYYACEEGQSIDFNVGGGTGKRP